MSRHRRTEISKPKTERLNEEIQAKEVRLIASDGKQLGVFALFAALEKARSQGLDLVEIAPQANPPVCKMMDYGKYQYRLKKERTEARKKQKVTQVKKKELRVRPTIEEGDYQVKLRNLIRFLEEGDRVDIRLRFRGREMTHKELGMEVLQRFIRDAEEYCEVERAPVYEGRQMMMVLVPKKK